MDLTSEQVLGLAPDASSAAAGRKLGNTRSWQSLGRSPQALWGECQGSALYQVRVDLADLTASCSCPSRKFPCKHGLGLLLLASERSDALSEGTPPGWVADWLAKRAAARENRRVEPAREVDAAQQAKRAEKRLAQVIQGLEGLDLWLCDLIRNGLAGVELQPTTFWEKQAARLVDAQAPGLAARVGRLAAIPGATPDWPERLLAGLGRLALLLQAFRRLDQLDPDLQADVRGLIGWTLKEDEVIARGELVHDLWAVLGRWIDDSDERVRTQRTWLLGTQTGRVALVLQFSAAGAPFGDLLVPGACLEADLVFWPSAYPQRALIRARHGLPARLQGRLPAASTTLEVFLAATALARSRQPWLDRFACALASVIPIHAGEGPWQIRDETGASLPLTPGTHWKLLALSGGEPIDLAGEWDGDALLPLGAMVNGAYHQLWEVRT